MVLFSWYRYHFTTEELGCQEIELMVTVRQPVELVKDEEWWLLDSSR
jgi:hypothetical protein